MPPPIPHLLLLSSASFATSHLIILLLALFAPCCRAFPYTSVSPAPPPEIHSPPPVVAYVETSPTSCKNWELCGDNNVSYPFWISHDDATINKPQLHCGYDGLRLFCQNNQSLILRLTDDSYTVTHIDYATHTLSLADSDVLGKHCPRVRHNLTFYDQSRFGYDAEQDTNLTFFFNCTSVDVPLPFNEIGCLPRFGTKRSYVFSVDSPDYDKFLKSAACDDVVVAPVLLEQLPSNENNITKLFDPALQQGFKLNWTGMPSDQCAKCERSGGRCGLNQTTNTNLAFTCFCLDGVMDYPNCKTRHKSARKKYIIIAAVVTTLALVTIFLFCIYKKKQKYSASSKSLVEDVSFGTNINKDSEMNSVNFQTRMFSYKELQEATNNFDSSRELGDGGFGTVYKGELRDGRIIAVKRLYENSYRRVEQFMNEVWILSQLHHPNLVDLYGCTSRHSRELLLVYEFVSNGTIADHLHGSRASEALLTWAMRLNIAIETADALRYLHAIEPPIIHRDIKSSNILLDASFHVKVADFGLSRLFPDNVTHVSTAPQGTPGYLDPEYHQCYQLTDKSDVYSFGVVLAELISSKPAVDITRRRSEINLASLAINKIQNGEVDQLVDPNLGYHSNRAVKKMMTMVAQLAFRCLQTDGDMRPPIKEVLEVLKEIEIEGCKSEKGGGDDDAWTRDDMGSVKVVPPPLSPDSVMHEWVSSSTTPNTSV